MSLICDTTTCHLYCDDKFFLLLGWCFKWACLQRQWKLSKFGWNELFCKPKSSSVTILCPNKSKINSIISVKWLGHVPIPQNTQFPVIYLCAYQFVQSFFQDSEETIQSVEINAKHFIPITQWMYLNRPMRFHHPCLGNKGSRQLSYNVLIFAVSHTSSCAEYSIPLCRERGRRWLVVVFLNFLRLLQSFNRLKIQENNHQPSSSSLPSQRDRIFCAWQCVRRMFDPVVEGEMEEMVGGCFLELSKVVTEF